MLVKLHYQSNVYKAFVNVSIHNLFFIFLMEKKIELNGFQFFTAFEKKIHDFQVDWNSLKISGFSE